MKYIILLLSLCNAFSSRSYAVEKIVVIANKSLDIKNLSVGEIKAYFLGETRFTESGQAVKIGDRDRHSSLHEDFYAQVGSMTPKDVSIYWAKKVFTGEAIPPVRLTGDDQETIAWVRSNLNGVSYIQARNIDNTIQIVGQVP